MSQDNLNTETAIVTGVVNTETPVDSAETPKQEQEINELENLLNAKPVEGDTSNHADRFVGFDVIATAIAETKDGSRKEENRQGQLVVAMFSNNYWFSEGAILALYKADTSTRNKLRETLLGTTIDPVTYGEDIKLLATLNATLGSAKLEDKKGIALDIALVNRRIQAYNAMFDRAAKTVWHLKNTKRTSVEIDPVNLRLTVQYVDETATAKARAIQIARFPATMSDDEKQERLSYVNIYINTVESATSLYKMADKALEEYIAKVRRNRVTSKASKEAKVVVSPVTVANIAATSNDVKLAATNAVKSLVDNAVAQGKPMIDVLSEDQHKANLDLLVSLLKGEFMDDQNAFDLPYFVDFLERNGFQVNKGNIKMPKAKAS